MVYAHKKVAVGFIFPKEDKFLFVKREHTGKCDGFYMFPAGHLEENETVLNACVREIKEELNVDVAPCDLELKMTEATQTHIHFFFLVKKYKGDLINNEPHKHACIDFLSADDERLHPAVRKDLQSLKENKVFTEQEVDF